MRQVRDLLTDGLAELLRAQPMSAGKVEFVWRLCVGPAMSRATRVELDADGTLQVVASAPHWAAEIRRASRDLRVRLGEYLGQDVVRRIRVR